MNQKSLVLISGIIVVILTGITVYFATTKNSLAPTVNEASIKNQQKVQTPENIQPEQKLVIYANDEFGFKIQLPDNWKSYTTKVNKNNAYELYDGKSISCPNCATINFYLPYNANWKLHQDVSTTGDVQVMTLQISDMDVWNTKCKIYCKDGGPSCTDCDDYLLNSEKFNFNAWYTVQFPDDINPETRGFHNSANEFFKGKFTLTKK
jgi:hypothetical protein